MSIKKLEKELKLKKKISFTGLELAEKLRKISIENIADDKKKFNKNWPLINTEIKSRIGQKIEDVTGKKIFDLGDSYREIFMSLMPTDIKNKREQKDLAIGGDGWERMVGWYLNLCLINTRAIVFKKKMNISQKKYLMQLL